MFFWWLTNIYMILNLISNFTTFDSAGDNHFWHKGLKVYWCFYRGIVMQGTQGQETISLYPFGNQVPHLPADQYQHEHEYPLGVWHSHGKWPIYRLLTYQNLLNMDIFHGYVRLPEGLLHVDQQSIHGWKQRAWSNHHWMVTASTRRISPILLLGHGYHHGDENK